MGTSHCVADLLLAPEGHRKIAWVSTRMPVLNRLRDRFQQDGLFRGTTVAVSVHLEAKTAYLCLVLRDLGAEVWATGSNPFSTKDDVAAALAEDGLHVFARHGVTEEDHRVEVMSLLSGHPQVVLDDGADICLALHEHPEFGTRVRGISEETTTGVARLNNLAREKRLLFPAITVNDARSKHLFDNRYGTGQSTWTAITHLTNMTVAGKTVVVLGYGWVGRGVATVARGMGAHVVITEIDPWKALEAHMDGYQVMTLEDASSIGHIFVTATGVEGALRTEHLALMMSGALVANAGHSDHEVDVSGLQRSTGAKSEVRENVFEYALMDGRKIYLLADGRIVNIAGGFGHPVEIMDMSFSLQLASLHYLLGAHLPTPGVYAVPMKIDKLVAREKLSTEGISIDSADRPGSSV
jgi:adenosylhomocysteinase